MNESHESFENKQIVEMLEAIKTEVKTPLFKNQYSIGQKWIQYSRRGKMHYLKKDQASLN